jgi:hypothetical protein
MGKTIRTIFKIDTLSLHECTDGYFLYDYIIGMNLSMRAKTEQDAYIEALLWYQKNYSKSKENYKELQDKVESFINQFI